ncbi:MAG: NAD(P)/FAD-dependent oxidoreductase [Pseudomonadota bacterium]
MQTLECDYLIIGSGAMGMAFADVLMHEGQATMVMVDQYHQPGGHWNNAYPFVRLHQPSAFYGVNSKVLGSNRVDQTGWNKGLYELATNSEVCAYFDQVMYQQFLPTDRLQYFPMCRYTGDGQFHSLVSDDKYQVQAHKIVDATYMNVTVPSMRPPAYVVADGVACAPPNQLPKLAGQYDRYVIVGAGKTGMDACLFLLRNGAAPEHITWIMPRDSWLLDRADIQPPGLSDDTVARAFAQQSQAIAESSTIAEIFERVAAGGQLLRFDDTVEPTMYRCATVTRAELEQLRRIPNIVRQGRVQQINPDAIELDGGRVATSTTTLHVDCSADGLERRPATPVFADDKITLQSVRTCQQVFSAAFIGHIEVRFAEDPRGHEHMNALCTPVPHPDDAIDFLRTTLTTNLNAALWAQDEELQQWLQNARLDGFSRPTDNAEPSAVSDEERAAEQAARAALLKTNVKAIKNLQRLLAEYDGTQ